MKAARVIRNVRTHPGGFVIIILLAFVALAGALIVLTGESTGSLSRSIRRERESIVLRQLLGSGRAWAQVHGDRLQNGDPVVLRASTALNEQSSAEITLRLRGTPGAIDRFVQVTASVMRNGRVISRDARIDLGATR